jgi:hypothetical protein
MDHVATVAHSLDQGNAQVQLLAADVKRWPLRDIVFRRPDGTPTNALHEVWVELSRSACRARFHCWTQTLGECSGAPFRVSVQFHDRYGRVVREVGWDISIPADLGIEYRLEAPFTAGEFDVAVKLGVPALRQEVSPCERGG